MHQWRQETLIWKKGHDICGKTIMRRGGKTEGPVGLESEDGKFPHLATVQ